MIFRCNMNSRKTSKYPDFKPEEFTKCVPACEMEQMNTAFMERLQTARTLAGVPFKLNSAFRSVDYELSHHRTGKSLHTLGRAVDIKCVDAGTRYRIIEALIAAGFHGIGVDNTFIHVDDRDLPLLWTY